MSEPTTEELSDAIADDIRDAVRAEIAAAYAVDGPPPSDLWASTADVVTTLGNLGPRIAATSSVNLDEHLAIGHSEAIAALVRGPYPAGLPVFRGSALSVLRWAVAKLAAARVLDILRASLDTTSELPERLRSSARTDLAGALPGYPTGAELDDEGQPLPPRPSSGPRVGYGAPGSLFADPYPWAW